MIKSTQISWLKFSFGIFVFLGIENSFSATSLPPVENQNSLLEMIERCAPTVHPETMRAIISAESRGHQFAIADAGPVNMPWSERKALVQSHYMGSVDEAEAKATALIAKGHTVSLGLSQVNDRNLSKLGVSVRDMFEPCANLSAGGKILTDFYQRAAKNFGPGEKALRAAISAYNSGSWIRGEKEGYVNVVYEQAGKPLVLKTEPVVPRIRANAAESAKNPDNKPTATLKKSKSDSDPNARNFTMSSRSFFAKE